MNKIFDSIYDMFFSAFFKRDEETTPDNVQQYQKAVCCPCQSNPRLRPISILTVPFVTPARVTVDKDIVRKRIFGIDRGHSDLA